MITNTVLEEISSRWQFARMAGEDAEYNGWTQPKIDAIVRSWQDIYPLFNEVKALQKDLYGGIPRRAMD